MLHMFKDISRNLNSDLSFSITEDTHHQHFQVSPFCWIFDETENERGERDLLNRTFHRRIEKEDACVKRTKQSLQA